MLNKPSKNVLILEFNELCPDLIDKFIDAGHLPNFKKLKAESIVYTTDAKEAQEHLEPWIQWVTVHTGVQYKEHQILNLGEASKLKHASIWDLVSNSGENIWVCGSMNVRPDAKLNGCVLPDPWSADTPVLPSELESFFKFVKVNVQEHTNSNVPLSKAEYLQTLLFLTKRGLSLNTVKTIFTQLIAEKVSNAGRWKRAIILDKLLWDIFAYYFKKNKPKLSTFFINSTAHFQHKFWRNMEPDKFKIKPTAKEQEQYSDAILFGYKQMDQIVGRAFDLAGEDTQIVFCSALSQQPFLKMEESGGKKFYRPHSFEQFQSIFNFQGLKKFSAVMSESFHIFFETKAYADSCMKQLEECYVSWNGSEKEKLFRSTFEGNDILTGCGIHKHIPEDAVVHIPSLNKEFPFYELFYQADSTKSGMHHPDGIFWIRTTDKSSRVFEKKVPLIDVAPTLLNIMGYAVPGQMTGKILADSAEKFDLAA